MIFFLFTINEETKKVPFSHTLKVVLKNNKKTLVPFWYASIPSNDENAKEIIALVLWKSAKWTPIHRWLCLLYRNSLQHWFKRHRLPHFTRLTSWRSNMERDEFVDSTMLFCKYTISLYWARVWAVNSNRT